MTRLLAVLFVITLALSPVVSGSTPWDGWRGWLHVDDNVVVIEQRGENAWWIGLKNPSQAGCSDDKARLNDAIDEFVDTHYVVGGFSIDGWRATSGVWLFTFDNCSLPVQSNYIRR